MRIRFFNGIMWKADERPNRTPNRWGRLWLWCKRLGWKTLFTWDDDDASRREEKKKKKQHCRSIGSWRNRRYVLRVVYQTFIVEFGARWNTHLTPNAYNMHTPNPAKKEEKKMGRKERGPKKFPNIISILCNLLTYLFILFCIPFSLSPFFLFCKIQYYKRLWSYGLVDAPSMSSGGGRHATPTR